MFASCRLISFRRPIWRLSSHHVHHRLQRVSRSPSPPQPPTRSTGGLFALLATMCTIQVYSTPFTGSVASTLFVARNFETSRIKIQYGRAYTLFTSTLYTPQVGSALLNMLWLVISGRHVCRAIGNTRFIALFVGSGGLANVVSLVSDNGVRDDPVFPRIQLPGGSSCAVDCIVTLNALLYPPSRVALTRQWMKWPLWFFSAMFLTRDEGERSPWEVDSAPRQGHVTGILCGLMAFLALRRPPRYI